MKEEALPAAWLAHGVAAAAGSQGGAVPPPADGGYTPGKRAPSLPTNLTHMPNTWEMQDQRSHAKT